MDKPSKDLVEVFVRVKPQTQTSVRCVSVVQNNCCLLELERATKYFTFDWVAPEEASQAEIYERIGKPILQACLEGYNGTIFAYGQTGSGKTFTIQGGMDGVDIERGLMPRIFENLFAFFAQTKLQDPTSECECTCSYLEIFHEQILDLSTDSQVPLNIREDPKGPIYVENLRKQNITNVEEAKSFLNSGARRRHVDSTAANERSSRSHAVFTLYVTSQYTDQGQRKIKSSRLHLIDLAGSENQARSNTSGDQLKQASSINKSLLNLGNVIRALVDGKAQHIPYRGSKLTLLLRDSLGGNSKTSVIATISPEKGSEWETQSTLTFAQRAKHIKNRAIINQTSPSMNHLQRQIEQLRSELSSSQQSITPPSPVDITNEPQYLNQVERIQMLEEEKVILEDRVLSLAQLCTSADQTISQKDMIIKLQKGRIERIKKEDDNIPDRIRDLEIENYQLTLRKESENPETLKFAIQNQELQNLVDAFKAKYGEFCDPPETAMLKEHLVELDEKHQQALVEIENLKTSQSQNLFILEKQQETKLQQSKIEYEQLNEKLKVTVNELEALKACPNQMECLKEMVRKSTVDQKKAEETNVLYAQALRELEISQSKLEKTKEQHLNLIQCLEELNNEKMSLKSIIESLNSEKEISNDHNQKQEITIQQQEITIHQQENTIEQLQEQIRQNQKQEITIQQQENTIEQLQEQIRQYVESDDEQESVDQRTIDFLKDEMQRTQGVHVVVVKELEGKIQQFEQKVKLLEEQNRNSQQSKVVQQQLPSTQVAQQPTKVAPRTQPKPPCPQLARIEQHSLKKDAIALQQRMTNLNKMSSQPPTTPSRPLLSKSKSQSALVSEKGRTPHTKLKPTPLTKENSLTTPHRAPKQPITESK